MSELQVSHLSPSAQNYLKVIWGLGEWSTSPVTTTMISGKLNVSKPAVSSALRRLVEDGLVVHDPYRAVELTPVGRRLALAMVRRHRLIETYLAKELGYGPHEVHDEAEVLEHAVSDEFMTRIDSKLGNPTRDPHGDPIPTADGVLVLPKAERLVDVTGESLVRVERVDDSDPEMLVALEQLGISFETHMLVHEAKDANDSSRRDVTVAGERVVLDSDQCAVLFVARQSSSTEAI